VLILLGLIVGGLIVGVAGCGPVREVRDAPTPASDSLPACADVWVDGAKLPADYAGCVDDQGILQAAATRKCTGMAGAFAVFDDRFYAIVGKTGESGNVITEAGPTSAEYKQAYTACFAGGW
jgi:hypothetical protein